MKINRSVFNITDKEMKIQSMDIIEDILLEILRKWESDKDINRTIGGRKAVRRCCTDIKNLTLIVREPTTQYKQ